MHCKKIWTHIFKNNFYLQNIYKCKYEPTRKQNPAADACHDHAEKQASAQEVQLQAPGIGCVIADAAFRAIRVRRQAAQLFLQLIFIPEQPQT